MAIDIEEYQDSDLEDMIRIWNNVVEEGTAFPSDEMLTLETGKEFFATQSHTGVAKVDGKVVGLYILHPNNIGRCGHISNTSYCVDPEFRCHHIGEALVRDSLEQARNLDFRILQLNAVVRTNYGAIHLYEKLGFVRVGSIPGGFLMKDGYYEDIIVFYYSL